MNSKILLLLLFCSQAAFADESRNRYTAPKANPEGMISSTMICARDIIKNNLGGSDGVRIAGQVIDDLKRHRNDPSEVESILDDCTDVKSKMTKDSSLSREGQKELVRNTMDLKTQKIIFEFINPTATCRQLELTAAVAAVIGVGTGINSSLCEATDGQRWVEVGAGAGMGIGLAVSASVLYGSITRDMDPKLIFSVRKSARGASGLILGIAADTQDIGKEADLKGWSVGLIGYFFAWTKFNVAFIPLKSNGAQLNRLLGN